ncbi:MAG: hypothetical protein ABJB11_17530 [Ferruginibacter sp.]
MNINFKQFAQLNLQITPSLILFLALMLLYSFADAQLITGVWKGKIDRKNVELKIIKNGDSLTGTSYYYESANSYRRYSIRGYFDSRDNSVVWWDDQLIEEKKGKGLFGPRAATPYLSTADFNCPGGTKMYLTGDAALKENEEKTKGPVDLQKFISHTFNDEWDFVIENYTFGANDPELIDSIGKMAFNKPVPVQRPIIEEKPEQPARNSVVVQTKKKAEAPVFKKEPEVKPVDVAVSKPAVKPVPVAVKKPAVKQIPVAVKEPVVTIAPLSIKEKFATRNKVVVQEIVVTSDSIELNFYDNAEVDGDSISIFLNNHLIYEHIRLTDNAYTIKMAVADLQDTNDLVMVAENLGSIPPNTSLMIAMIDGKRYEQRLESTEQTSAAIRFVKRPPAP